MVRGLKTFYYPFILKIKKMAILNDLDDFIKEKIDKMTFEELQRVLTFIEEEV